MFSRKHYFRYSPLKILTLENHKFKQKIYQYNIFLKILSKIFYNFDLV